MQVEIVERSPIKAWTMRLRGAMTPENFKDSYSRLWQWEIDHGIAGRTKEAMGIFFDGDGEGGDNAFRYYAGVIRDEPLKADGGIEVLEVPGGKYASYRLIGSYHGIPVAFQRLYGEWLPKSGFVPDDLAGAARYLSQQSVRHAGQRLDHRSVNSASIERSASARRDLLTRRARPAASSRNGSAIKRSAREAFGSPASRPSHSQFGKTLRTRIKAS